MKYRHWSLVPAIVWYAAVGAYYMITRQWDAAIFAGILLEGFVVLWWRVRVHNRRVRTRALVRDDRMKRAWTIGWVTWCVGWTAFDMIAHLWVIAICMGIMLEFFIIWPWWRTLRERESVARGLTDVAEGRIRRLDWVTAPDAFTDDPREAYRRIAELAFVRARGGEAAYSTAREKYEQDVARQAVTRQRCKEVLLSVLSAEERETYLREAYIPVQGSLGGRYEIHPSWSNNVHAGQDRWCAIVPGIRCLEGQMIAQYLALVTDERAFLDVAIHHRVDTLWER